VAKELVVLSWCDVCQDEDTRTEGTSYTLGIGNGKLLELELCDRHAKPVEEVIELLAEHGKPPTDELPLPSKRGPYKKRQPSTAPQAAASPLATATRRRPPLATVDPRSDEAAARNVSFCLICAVGYGSSFGLNTHLKQEHDLAPATQTQVLGTVCPACGEDCDNVRALSNHATKEHGLAGSVGRIFALEAKEDKYGVVSDAIQRHRELSGTLV